MFQFVFCFIFLLGREWLLGQIGDNYDGLGSMNITLNGTRGTGGGARYKS